MARKDAFRSTVALAVFALTLLLHAATASAQTALAGGWHFSDGTDLAGIIFYPSGEFSFAQFGPADSHGHSGIERGTYAWDPLTQLFTAHVTLDTNVQWGFSDPFGVEAAAVSGSQFTLTDLTGPNAGDSATFDRTFSASSAIVNAWSLRGTPGTSDLDTLWFTPDGHYLLAIDESGAGYFQAGSYTWDSATGALQLTPAGSDIAVGSTFSGFSASSASVLGNTLLLGTNIGDLEFVAANVPEPETYALLLVGLPVVLARRRRLKRRAAL